MQNIVAHKEMSILIYRGERCKASSFELRVVKADDVHDFYFFLPSFPFAALIHQLFLSRLLPSIDQMSGVRLGRTTPIQEELFPPIRSEDHGQRWPIRRQQAIKAILKMALRTFIFNSKTRGRWVRVQQHSLLQFTRARVQTDVDQSFPDVSRRCPFPPDLRWDRGCASLYAIKSMCLPVCL